MSASGPRGSAEPVNASMNARVVRQLFACFGQGDITGAVGLLSDDIEWRVPGRPEVMPWAGTHVGRERVAWFFTVRDGQITRLQEYHDTDGWTAAYSTPAAGSSG